MNNRRYRGRIGETMKIYQQGEQNNCKGMGRKNIYLYFLTSLKRASLQPNSKRLGV
jgi:hypothetical protein